MIPTLQAAQARSSNRAPQDLIAAIEDYLAASNDDPRPFVWTATAEEILEKVRRGRVTLERITG